MGAGLTIYNDKNNLQIDADYHNLALHPTVTTIPAGRTMPNRMFDTWGLTPIFAVQPDTHGNYVNIHKNTSHYYPGTGKVYSFEDKPSNISLGFGLELYDADGNISYTSEKKGITVLDYVKSNNRTNVNEFWTKNYGHTNIAVIPTQSPIGFTRVQHNGVAYGMAFKLTTTGTLTASMTSFTTVAPAMAESVPSTYDFEFIVIDVSRYQ